MGTLHRTTAKSPLESLCSAGSAMMLGYMAKQCVGLLSWDQAIVGVGTRTKGSTSHDFYSQEYVLKAKR